MARKKTTAPSKNGAATKPKAAPKAQRRTKATAPGHDKGSGRYDAIGALELFLQQFGSEYADRSAVAVTPYSAMTYSAFWACVNLIAESLAMIGWHVFEAEGERGKKKLEEDAVAKLLNTKPNDEMNAVDFRYAMAANALVQGNAYAEIERDGRGDPVALWPIASERVCLERNAAGRLVYVVDKNKGNESRLDPSMVFHHKGPSPDGLVGYSVVAMARRSIQLGMSQESYGDTYFRRGPMPGGILKIPGHVKKEERDAMRQSFDATYGGSKNAGRTVALSGGIEWTPISIPNDDAQFLESRTFQVEEICRWFRIPPYKLGIMSKTSYSSQEQSAIEYVQYAMMPWAVRLEKEADIKLFGRVNRGRKWTKLNLAALMRGDSATQAANLQKLVTGGLLTPNEAREELDRNPMAGADELLVQGAMVPLDRALEEPKPETEPQQPPASDDKSGSGTGEGGASEPVPAATTNKSRSVDPAFISLFRDKMVSLFHTEMDKASRAENKGKLEEHVEALYGGPNATHIGQQVRPAVDAFAAVFGLCRDNAGSAANAIASECNTESRNYFRRHGAANVAAAWNDRPQRMAERAAVICFEKMKETVS